MKRLYNSRDPRCKTPFGALKTGEQATFRLFLSKSQKNEDPVMLIFGLDDPGNPVALPMRFVSSDMLDNCYQCEYCPGEPGLKGYYFEVFSNGSLTPIRLGQHGDAVAGEQGGFWQLTVYDKNALPNALCGGVMYQIFPDRFCNSGSPKDNVPEDRVLREDWGGMPVWRPDGNGEVTNSDYFGGDFAGIEEKLGYLESLGVTAIYLNPIFEAHANHRYNTADYEKADPLLGTNEDFARLAAEAKKRGISLILDGVFSHTGSDSKYFNKKGRYGDGGAFRDPQSPYRSWYQFQNWPDAYVSWWGFNTLPNVDELNPDYLEYICGEGGVLQQWLERGAKGFRLDVADELPDGFLDALRERVKTVDPGAAVIGEVWEDASNKQAYGHRRRYLLGRQLDSVMNYPFRDAVLGFIRWGNGEVFLDIVLQIIENYPAPALASLMNSLSTHDTERALTMLVGEPPGENGREWQEQHHWLTLEQYRRGCRMLSLAGIMQFGLPGIPCVYYGDEAGLSGYRDPFNRCCYPWGHENQELIRFFAQLGAVRKNYPIFADAEFIPFTFGRDVCSFARRKGDIAVVFAVNRGDGYQPLSLPEEFFPCETLVLLGDLREGILGPQSGAVQLVMRKKRDA